MTPNDGYLFHNNIAVSAGDIFTIRQGACTLDTASGINPGATQTFTGNMFLTNQAGATISAMTVVPEPATLSLLAGAFAVHALIRRRQALLPASRDARSALHRVLEDGGQYRQAEEDKNPEKTRKKEVLLARLGPGRQRPVNGHDDVQDRDGEDQQGPKPI